MVNMNERDRLTPINRRRERGLRWSNDSVWGERFARWLGSVLGGLQFHLEHIRPSSDIPWTPLKRPLAQATVAVVSTAGVHLCSGAPFNLTSDASFRVIPRTARATDLCITHEHYDRRDAARDLNLVFPLQRLLELEAEGIVGRVADTHYGFGFTDNPKDLLAPGREVGALLARAGIDLVLLVPA
jgi:D-proline reductase (dithiol) PrdB